MIKSQMVQIDRQLSSLPETGLELARLLREVKTHEQIYAMLLAQYEEARIDEARDVVTVDVLDPSGAAGAQDAPQAQRHDPRRVRAEPRGGRGVRVDP